MAEYPKIRKLAMKARVAANNLNEETGMDYQEALENQMVGVVLDEIINAMVETKSLTHEQISELSVRIKSKFD